MCDVVTLHEHLITQQGGKVATAQRVAPEKPLQFWLTTHLEQLNFMTRVAN